MKKDQSKVRVIQKKNEEQIKEDLFDIFLEKGYIEKTPYGYYFKREFYETLDLCDT